MNIVEAYIKYRGQLIILISGMSGSGVLKLARRIEKEFELAFVNYKDFIIPNFSNMSNITVDGKEIKVNNFDTDMAIDWESFISEIKKHQKNGVVVACQSFPSKKLDEGKVNPDMHLHIKLGKQNLLKRRIEYSKKELDDATITAMLNKFTIPYEISSSLPENSKITKFINANDFVTKDVDGYNEEIYDMAFEYIIGFINRWLNENKHKITKTEHRHEPSKINNKKVREDKEDKEDKEEASSTSSESSESLTSSESSKDGVKISM